MSVRENEIGSESASVRRSEIESERVSDSL